MYKETSIISNARLSTNHEKNVLFWWKLGHMHTREHHTEQMDAWHKSFFFKLLLSWHHTLMRNGKCCIQSTPVCNTMMNDLTMPCFCPVCTSVCIPSIYLIQLVCTIVYGQHSLQSAALAL